MGSKVQLQFECYHQCMQPSCDGWRMCAAFVVHDCIESLAAFDTLPLHPQHSMRNACEQQLKLVEVLIEYAFGISDLIRMVQCWVYRLSMRRRLAVHQRHLHKHR